MALSFKKEFIDTGIVSMVKTWCFGKDPVVSPIQVGYAAGTSKFSICAGYTFTCPKVKGYNTLKIVYCAKLHSKIFRRDPANRSRWYIWQQIGKDGCIVMTSEECEEKFGFDVYKFAKTAEFQKGQQYFEKMIKHGISAAKKLRNEVEKDNREEFDTWISSLEEASNLVTDIPDFNESGYKLIDFDKFRKELKDKGYGGELRQRADNLSKSNINVGKRFMSRVHANALKAGEQDRAANR